MKQFIASIFLILFAFQSTGASVYLHFCGKQVVAVSLLSSTGCGPEDASCYSEETKKPEETLSKSHCCSDKVLNIDLPSATTVTDFPSFVFGSAIPVFSGFLDLDLIAEAQHIVTPLRGPPFLERPAKFILFQTLKIPSISV
ncbi:MAG: amino acid transporter [Sphingobacteriales bacterium]|jgi:amino acid transporter